MFCLEVQHPHVIIRCANILSSISASLRIIGFAQCVHFLGSDQNTERFKMYLPLNHAVTTQVLHYGPGLDRVAVKLDSADIFFTAL